MQQSPGGVVSRLKSVGSDQDAVRATTVSIAVVFMLVTFGMSRWAVDALHDYKHSGWVYTVLAISLVLAGVAGGWHLNVWRVAAGLGSVMKSALLGGNATPKPIVLVVVSANVARSFYLLITSVIALLAGLIYLVQTTGGVEKSPFLQFVLAYSVSGVLIASKPTTKLLLLVVSVVLPLILLLPDPSDFGGEYSRATIAVFGAIATMIAGITNLVTSRAQVASTLGPVTQQSLASSVTASGLVDPQEAEPSAPAGSVEVPPIGG